MPRQRPRRSLRARRVPTVRALRQKLNLTQEEFAKRFHLSLGTVRDWEQGAHRPDKATQVLLTVIAKDPDAVARALECYCRLHQITAPGHDQISPIRSLSLSPEGRACSPAIL